MRLSELVTGDRAIIVKVKGHGGFRRRIIEMGFIKGKEVEVLLAAPLQDPVKYRVMGYEVSLRHNEAEMIEVIGMEETDGIAADSISQRQDLNITEQEESITDRMKELALLRRRTINVALVGNPNSGKTSFFNYISGSHEHVGNYGGVTVSQHEGSFDFQGYHFKIVDLPGTYSLSAYSPEERYVRHHLNTEHPDVVINVLDTTNLERNLYLTTQLLDMNVRFVCALNMYDEFQASGNRLDHHLLSKLFGVPMIPTISKTGGGIEALFHVIIHLYEGADFLDEHGKMHPDVLADLTNWHHTFVDKSKRYYHHSDTADENEEVRVVRHIHVNHGQLLEQCINALRAKLSKEIQLRSRYSLRFLSIKLLEHDKDAEQIMQSLQTGDEILQLRNSLAAQIREELHEDSEAAITNAKYGFISGALKETFEDNHQDQRQATRFIDSIVTHRIWGYPIFLLFLWVMFQCTFSLGQYPMDAIDWCVGSLSDWLAGILPDGSIKALLVDGILAGVGGVIVFLPNILILYFFISLMEDSGYMARVAFIMDKIMHKIGLHGKSFIPMIMGFGCNVPAIMATRTIESRNNRLITMLAIPFMTCSARLPIYLLFTGIFFPKNAGLVMFSLYLIGIVLAIAFCKVMSSVLLRHEDIPFVMELPPYRTPMWKSVYRHTWERGKQYIRKMGSIILLASVFIWCLSYYPAPADNSSDARQRQEQSYLGQFGKAIEPVLEPIGMNWKLGVALLGGAGAKEVVAGTVCVLYSPSNADPENLSVSEASTMSSRMQKDGITPFVAYCFLLFVLIYFPCIGALVAIRNESGKWRWMIFMALYSTSLAYLVAFAVYQVGTKLFGL